MQPFGRNRYGPKIRGGGAGSPPNTMWPGPRPTCVPSFILIRTTVWPQCTNVTDRQTGQWTDSIGRTVLQTVAHKPIQLRSNDLCDSPRSQNLRDDGSLRWVGFVNQVNCKPRVKNIMRELWMMSWKTTEKDDVKRRVRARD